MYACITGNIDDITVIHRHSVQQAAACTATGASSHFRNAVWLNNAAHACAYAHSWSCQSLATENAQWPVLQSVLANNDVCVFKSGTKVCNNCHATPREACYPLLWTMWWVSSKCHFIYCCNDVYNLWIGQGQRYCFDGNNSATSPHSQTATSILAIIKVWK